MRFGAHQSFHLRDSWLYKGLNAVNMDAGLLNKEKAVEELGVGKNMVEAIKFWLTALDLVVVEEGEYFLTELAAQILEEDPYFEMDGTLLLAHYLLARNKEGATSWYWFFNKLGATEFDTESLNVLLNTYVQSENKKVNENTLKKDINCILRMYREPEYGERVNPETENPSPFVKFRMVEAENKKLFRKKVRVEDIDPLVFVYLTYVYWLENLNEPESMNLEEIVTKECSPGMILGLSLEDTIHMIEEVMKQHGDKYLDYNSTGGYNIINMKKRTAKNALSDYYKTSSLTVN